jgi:hypothetical protein
MTDRLLAENKTALSSTQLLNLYISSGGKKVTYEEVITASQREKREKKLSELKRKYKWLFPLMIVIYFASLTAEESYSLHT